MKLPFKILFINLSVAVGISILLLIGLSGNFKLDEFFIALGLVALGGAAIDLLIGIILLATGNKESGKGFMLSAGVLLLIGFASCGIGLQSLNFH
jgi:uncharacterized membrane protein YozB (DUF420 family)